MAAERRRKRDALLERTEADALKMAADYAAGQFGRDELNRRLGTLRRRKMGKHFRWQFDDATQAFSSQRDAQSIQAQARLDGLYVIRTSLAERTLGDDAVVRAYKRLAQVERAFRSLKTTVLKVRPIFHWKERRVRAPVRVHAGLLLGMAHAPQPRATAVRRRGRAGGGGQPGRPRPALPAGPPQGLHAHDVGRPAAAAELPGPAREPVDADGHRAGVRASARPRHSHAERDDPAAQQSVRTAGAGAAPRSGAGPPAARRPTRAECPRLVTNGAFSSPPIRPDPSVSDVADLPLAHSKQVVYGQHSKS